MSASVLAADPEGMQVVAAALRVLSADLVDAADGVADGGGLDGWRGLAALEQGARRAASAAAVRSVASPLEEAAHQLDRIAAVASELGGRVRRHLAVAEALVDERARLLSYGAQTDDLAGQGWRSRLAEVEAEITRLRRLVAEAEEEFDRAQQGAASGLGWLTDGMRTYDDLKLLREVVTHARDAGRAGLGLSIVAMELRRLHRQTVPGGERIARRVAQGMQRAQRLVVQKPKGWIKRLPVVGRVATGLAMKGVPVMTLVDAVPDVVTGGGHGGWRGTATRVLAGAAVVGVVGAVVVSSPVAVPAGIVAAGAYQAWVAGGWIYDNRREIGGATRRVWRQGGTAVSTAREVARSGLRRLRDRLSDQLRAPVAGDRLVGVAP
ncbi:hypothetical protein [Ornithinimicrobium tianjinense]|uniref:Uncharacterized protein n=1 Tax=Ornithinimicrobium tianjinense TaxID=1195761 RepID=A0A917F5Z2_9MICO|nr:hypothetical protein [Ornithinimicrobium tianjinense]GGF50010.1 hypothetical protein GCM10011366_17370 [Ornithinimicrobium tianjinense]